MYINKYLNRSLALMLLVLTIGFCYFPGITGSFYYDDIRPLSRLADVTDFSSALYFVSTETSGTLGRPLAMITFLLNVNDWPDNQSGFFIVNIILHIFNGLLVFGLSYFISLLFFRESSKNYWIGLGAAAFWLVLPLQVSTSLIAIQRMAGLSAFFVFSGLLLYVYGLHQQNSNSLTNNKNTVGLAPQLTGLFICTLLAMFSKENGILLPVFALVLELTVLRQIPGINHRRKLRIYGCSLGLITILAYLCFFTFNSNNILIGRNFTLTERLITQPQILLEYLQLAFLPNVNAFNPFHDNYQHVEQLLF